MFQFPGFALMTYGFSHKYPHDDPTNPKAPAQPKPNQSQWIYRIEGGFPHSEIPGSKPVRGSPRLIAAYHVLHRLSSPRHPPDTLKTLDRFHYQCSPPKGMPKHAPTRQEFRVSTPGRPFPSRHTRSSIDHTKEVHLIRLAADPMASFSRPACFNPILRSVSR